MILKMQQALLYLQQIERLPQATGKVGYAIYKNITILNNATKEFRQMQNDLIKKYGQNNSINEKSPNWQKFVQELKPLLDIECDVNLFQISEDEIYNEVFTPQDYFVLHEIVVKKEDSADKSKQDQSK